MSKRIATNKPSAPPVSARAYETFDEIDGRHPWQTEVPDGFVAYPVRRLDRGKVLYFNFSLAREMGLLPSQHPNELTPALTKKILDTFSIQIVNEYDQQNSNLPPKDAMKTHPYMATRYLQLQHANKQGKTSGDGRSIWNGTFRRRGLTWDVSSRGTGVTCLSPGAVEAQRPLKTGEEEFGYGCGLADVTELVGSAVMSEIFHLNGLGTERVLTVIDLGKGCGIGVRAAPNLIRPAHIFLYLKQGRSQELRQATDYFIKRQFENGAWTIAPNDSARYAKMLKQLSLSFARFTARLERQYIFAWMDWDGDNVLADAGIIDYGSIRQFGLRHDQYRYDDVQRFSTTLNEQRGKARLAIQVFAQAVCLLETGKRRAFEDFANHSSVRDYDREFDREVRRIFLEQMGCSDEQIALLSKKHMSDVDKLYSAFLVLEKTKTKAGPKKLPDGVNRPAVFNMRAALRELPERWPLVPTTPETLEIIASSFAKRADRKLKGSLREKIESFLNAYTNVVMALGIESKAGLLQWRVRATDQNRAGRITGNGAEYIVDALLNAKRKGLTVSEIQSAIDLFIASQAPSYARPGRRSKAASLDSGAGRLLQELVTIAQDFEEDI
ncbi:MAG: hypothetical protein AAB250_04030 [Bdellovibrionota bacterium]|mgnify:CR=1 FL=1